MCAHQIDIADSSNPLTSWRNNISPMLFDPLTKHLKLQPHTQDSLKRLRIETVRDLLFHRPASYFTNKICTGDIKFKHGEQIIIEATVHDIEAGKMKRPTKIYTETSAGTLILVFFNKIPPFLLPKLRPGFKCMVEGKVEFNQGFYFQIVHPNFIFDQKQVSEIEPIYPLTYGITSKQIYGYILKIIEKLESEQPQKEKADKFSLACDSVLALLKSLHIPPSIKESDIENTVSELAKYELLTNQISLAYARNQRHNIRGRSFTFSPDTSLQSTVLQTLGFTLTEGQEIVLTEIQRDQSQNYRMVRMLQGDVGSGKTLVALLSMLNVASSNVQSALMAPTDLLASQHFEFFKKALQNTPVEIALLTGKTKTRERRILLAKLAEGEILILIGTHAVFQQTVNFKDLGYIIIDEQHRFGVEQRTELINKASMPDLLVMTATPIPRSLTLTLFGDMASSRLTSKPKGRVAIATIVMSRTRLNEVMAAIGRKLDRGEKIYWICPLIEVAEEKEEDEKLMDVASRFNMVENLYPGQVGYVHGKMKNDQKDLAMQEFKEGKTKILIATTVIEVGIDVPDATLIIIENAEKFGLAQLHQLRGRVGRSSLESHAVLLYEPTRTSAVARQRMEIMRESVDGFYISEQDLLLRGGGEILGIKQSGQQNFIFADLGRDMKLLNECNEYANKIKPEEYENFALLLKLFAKRENSEVLE